MFGIRRRWPVLTAVVAVLLYIINNYQISGLQHLQLEAVKPAAQARPQPNPNSLDPWTGGGLGIDLTQFGIQTSSSLPSGPAFNFDSNSATTAQSSPAWSNALSLGEKLALWQDKLSPQQTSPHLPASGSVSFPTSSPIPAPQDLIGFGPNGALGGALNFASSPSEAQRIAPIVQEAIRPGTMTSLEGTNLANQWGRSSASALGQTSGPRDRTIRMASFYVPSLGPDTLSQPHLLQILVSILTQYDVVALQGIQSSRDDILPMLVDQLNQSGRKYDYLIGPRVGRFAPHQQFAYVFDTDKLETDRYALYSVEDPEDLMNREPLVAWFRCKGVPVRDAFTFSLVNLSIDPNFADAERALLPGLIEAIEKDGRQEDDWILLGNFAGGNSELSMLDANAVRFAITDIATDVAGTRMLDTLLFSSRATTEFTGRAGVFDFLRKYNLSMERALEISPRMPVWAEFSSLEGSQPGRIAPLIQ